MADKYLKLTDLRSYPVPFASEGLLQYISYFDLHNEVGHMKFRNEDGTPCQVCHCDFLNLNSNS